MSQTRLPNTLLRKLRIMCCLKPKNDSVAFLLRTTNITCEMQSIREQNKYVTAIVEPDGTQLWYRDDNTLTVGELNYMIRGHIYNPDRLVQNGNAICQS